MANIPISPGSGDNVATTTITRDGVTEHMQLLLIADPITGITASVTPPGSTGADGLAVQGMSGGVPLPVSGTVAIGAGSAAIGTVALGAGAASVGTVTVGNPPTTDAGNLLASIVSNSGSPSIIKGSAGKLCRVLVTAVNSGGITFYNNTSGTNTGIILGIISSGAVVGEVFDFGMPATSGISVPVQANNPAVSISYQ